MVIMVEPYRPERGLEVINEHAPYIPEDPYVSVDPYMIYGISFYECLKATHKEVLEDQAAIVQLNSKIL